MTGLTKPKTIDIADSNIAGLGTELEKQVRLNAAKTEKAWTVKRVIEGLPIGNRPRAWH